MGGKVSQRAPQQEEERWTPKILGLNPATSARNNITRKKGDRSTIGSGRNPRYDGGIPGLGSGIPYGSIQYGAAKQTTMLGG